MWVVIALGAIILVALFVAIVRVGHISQKRRKEARNRPVYRSNQTTYALADWYLSCQKSLDWSHSRRNKESN